MPECRYASGTMDAEITDFFEQVIPLRLAFLTSDGSPAVASHWYLYEQGSVWCAVQQSSFVARCLAADPRCAFEVAGDEPPYRGVRGRGRAELVPERGEEVLRRLMARYLGDGSADLRRYLLARAATETAVRIEATKLSSWDYTERMR